MTDKPERPPEVKGPGLDNNPFFDPTDRLIVGDPSTGGGPLAVMLIIVILTLIAFHKHKDEPIKQPEVAHARS